MTNKFDITKFKLFLDNILVKAIQIEKRGMAVKPANYEDKPNIGEVISVGTGRVFDTGVVEPIDLKKGDTILFNMYSATKYNLDGNEYYVIRIEDVIGKQ